jgi:hypothetical protein
MIVSASSRWPLPSTPAMPTISPARTSRLMPLRLPGPRSPTSCSTGSPQVDWLQATLAANRGRLTHVRQVVGRRDSATLVRLIAVFRQTQPDLLFAYTIKPVVYGLIAAKRARDHMPSPAVSPVGAFSPSRRPRSRL